jgi:hypothetical protein
VRPDDILRVNTKGRVFEAFVLAKSTGRLGIEPLQRGVSYTTASAREVICHCAPLAVGGGVALTEMGVGALAAGSAALVTAPAAWIVVSQRLLTRVTQ